MSGREQFRIVATVTVLNVVWQSIALSIYRPIGVGDMGEPGLVWQAFRKTFPVTTGWDAIPVAAAAVGILTAIFWLFRSRGRHKWHLGRMVLMLTAKPLPLGIVATYILGGMICFGLFISHVVDVTRQATLEQVQNARTTAPVSVISVEPEFRFAEYRPNISSLSIYRYLDLRIRLSENADWTDRVIVEFSDAEHGQLRQWTPRRLILRAVGSSEIVADVVKYLVVGGSSGRTAFTHTDDEWQASLTLRTAGFPDYPFEEPELDPRQAQVFTNLTYGGFSITKNESILISILVDGDGIWQGRFEIVPDPEVESIELVPSTE